MDRTEIFSPSALALVLLVAAACAVAQSSRGNGEERALRKLNPIYLELDERRFIDRNLVERVRCEQGVLIVRPFGRTALVYCELHARPSPQISL